MLVPVDIQSKCQDAMRELENLFPPGCELTLLMRNLDVPGCDMIVTKDDLWAVIQSILWIIEVEQEQQSRESN